MWAQLSPQRGSKEASLLTEAAYLRLKPWMEESSRMLLTLSQGREKAGLHLLPPLPAQVASSPFMASVFSDAIPPINQTRGWTRRRKDSDQHTSVPAHGAHPNTPWVSPPRLPGPGCVQGSLSAWAEQLRADSWHPRASLWGPRTSITILDIPVCPCAPRQWWQSHFFLLTRPRPGWRDTPSLRKAVKPPQLKGVLPALQGRGLRSALTNSQCALNALGEPGGSPGDRWVRAAGFWVIALPPP